MTDHWRQRTLSVYSRNGVKISENWSPTQFLNIQITILIFCDFWKVNITMFLLRNNDKTDILDQSKVKMVLLWVRLASLQMDSHLKLRLRSIQGTVNPTQSVIFFQMIFSNKYLSLGWFVFSYISTKHDKS